MGWQLGRNRDRPPNTAHQRRLPRWWLGVGLGVLFVVGVAVALRDDLRSILPDKFLATFSRSSTRSSSTDLDNAQLQDFAETVFADAVDTWDTRFTQAGGDFQAPTLTVFTDRTESACGMVQPAFHSVYCADDQTVYVNLGSYRTLKAQYPAQADVAQAYVIARAVGQHVQQQLGITDQVQQLQHGNPSEVRQLSLRLALQADCFAGFWTHHSDQAQSIFTGSDRQGAVNAIRETAGDRPPAELPGVVPLESLMPGTLSQHLHWLNQGIEHGDLARCNTFGTAEL